MRLIYLFIFLFTFITAKAQVGQKIYEVLELESGCPLPTPSKVKPTEGEDSMVEEEIEFVDMAVEVAPPPPPPPPPPYPAVKKKVPPPSPSEEMFDKYLQNLKKSIKENPVEVVSEFGENEFFQNENYLWGLRTKSGEILIEPTYEYIKVTSRRPHFVAQEKGNKYLNLFDISGKKLLAKDYDQVDQNVNLDYVWIGRKGERGIFLLEENIIIEPEYQYISKFEDYWIIKKNDLFGLLDRAGKMVIAPRYKKLKPILGDHKDAYFAIEEGKELRIYKGGKELYRLGIKFYEYAEPYIFEGRYLFYNKQLIDLKKNQFLFCGEKIEIEKTRIGNNIFSLRKDRKNWVFNEKGILVTDQPLKVRTSSINFGMEEVAILAVNSEEKSERGYSIPLMGLVNKKLEWVVAPTYYSMTKMRDTSLFVAANKSSMYGMLDANGKEVMPFIHQFMLPIGDRILTFEDKKSGACKVLDIAGNFLFETTLNHKRISKNSIGYEGRRLSDSKRVILNDKFEEIYAKGYNNAGMFGKEAFWIERFDDPKFYEIVDMKGATYPVMIDGKPRTDLKNLDRIHRTPFFFLQFSDGGNFLYNTNLKKAYPINPEIGSVSDGLYTSNGMFITAKSYRKSMGLIDTLGNEILPPMFESINKIYENSSIFSVRTKTKTSTFTFNGKQLFEEYESASFLFDHFFAVKKEGKTGVLKMNGEILIPFEYKAILKKHPNNFEAATFEGKKIIFSRNGARL